MDSASFLAAEQRHANEQARTLDPDAYDRWYANRSGHRIVTYLGKKLIVYRLMFGTPTILDTLRCEGLSVSFESGAHTIWHSKVKGLITVNHTPTEVAESCFLWHLQNSTLEYKRHAKDLSASISMSWKVPMNPHTRKDGVVYLQEHRAFYASDWQVDA